MSKPTGRFSTALTVQLTGQADFPFRVTEPFEFHPPRCVDAQGRFIRVPQNFIFDGTSMPRGLRWLISTADPQLLQCAAGHDIGFREGVLIRTDPDGTDWRTPATRQQINGLMALMMRAARVARWKRWVILAGLRVGSSAVWREHRARYTLNSPRKVLS